MVLDAFAPRRCAACDTVAARAMCRACEASIAALPQPQPMDSSAGLVVAAFPFEAEVREALHAGKFQGNRPVLRRLAELAVHRFDLAALAVPDAVVPVPLGRRRRRQRGYNQAAVAAAVIATACSAPVIEGLVRSRETPPQTRRGGAARRANVAGAFAWRGPDLAGSSLWIVDDVVTTGATLEVAGSALRRAGARRVDALVLARAR